MRIVFGNWKYIIKNIWYVLPFSLVPAVFLALSLDYTAISGFMEGFFSGAPRMDFIGNLRVWSFLRIDSWTGAIYSVLAVICCAVFMSLMLAFVEKHMRIGKRTISGVFSQLFNLLFSALLITAVYFVLYEVWAIVMSALLFVIAQIRVTALVYVLMMLVICGLVSVLLYVAVIFFLWLPCRQVTGFGVYDAFLYSYRLAVGVRGRLILAWLLSLATFIVVIAGVSLLPEYVFRLTAILLFVVLFMGFGVRMETVYFETDKLDREDVIKSYREL